MKKTFCAILVIAFIFVLSVPAFAEEEFVYYDANNLSLNCSLGTHGGFTQYAAGSWPYFFDTLVSMNGGNTVGYPSMYVNGFSVPSGSTLYFSLAIPTLEYGFDADLDSFTITIRSGQFKWFTITYNFASNAVQYNNTYGVFNEIYDCSVDGGYINLIGIVSDTIDSISWKCELQGNNLIFVDEVIKYTFGGTELDGPILVAYEKVPVSIEGVSLMPVAAAPYYPGTEVQLSAIVTGTGIDVGSPESALYWYVHGNTSVDTYIDNNGLLTIANDETSAALEIEAVSTYDATKSDSVTIPVSYPLLGSMVVPSGTQTFVESSKRQEVQFELILPNGEPFNYTDIEWTIQPSAGASSYFRIDDQGLLVVEPNAPAGSRCTVHFAYGFDTDNVSAAGATVKVVSTQEGIYDNLTPTPEQNDKAEEMEDAIGDAADKLENNNSSLGQLTPTRPQINTDLEFDQDQMLAVSPLVTNIWSINGLGRMISIVLVVATVAYIFFGKRDG